MTDSALNVATAVSRVAAPSEDESAIERFSAFVPEVWLAPSGKANGGFLTVLAVRALQAVLPQPDPLAVSVYFERAVAPGPVSIATQIHRQGRRLGFGTAVLSVADVEVARATASFGSITSEDDGPAGAGRSIGVSAPDLPPPDDCFDLFAEHADRRVGMLQQLDFRYPERPGWHAGQPSGSGQQEFWLRLADGSTPDLVALAGLVDMAPPVIYEQGLFATTTVELTSYLWAVSAPGWLRCRMTGTQLRGGRHDENFEIWDSTGALVAQGRQLLMLL